MTTRATDLLLLDTNVLVHVLRGGALGRRVNDELALESRPMTPLISIVSVAEMIVLTRRWNWGDKKVEAMERLLASLVRVNVAGKAVVDAYTAVMMASDASGVSVKQNDAWIAACAIASGATLVTFDGDFDWMDSSLLNVERLHEA